MPIKKASSFLTSADLSMVQQQMKGRRLDSSNLIGVAKRCAWGHPQVLLCRPVQRGRPFPTIFWLSCPWLVRVCGAAESRGGVGELESFLVDRMSEWRKFQLKYSMKRLSLLSNSEVTFLRSHRRRMWEALRGSGVGGIDFKKIDAPTVKCLHLQVASWLGLGEHPGGAWLKNTFPLLNCSSEICAKKI